MINNEEELKKWLKDKYPYEEKSEEEIQKDFIDAFGIEKWNEIEAEVKLDKLNLKLCNFLGIEPVPVVFEEMYEDARYYNDLDYIAISNRYVFDEIEQMKSLIHEVKHLHQKYCISHKNENLKFANLDLIKDWEADFKKNQRLIPEDILICMAIEVDAFAFTKYILNNWFSIDYHHHDLVYDTILDHYIKKYYR